MSDRQPVHILLKRPHSCDCKLQKLPGAIYISHQFQAQTATTNVPANVPETQSSQNPLEPKGGRLRSFGA